MIFSIRKVCSYIKNFIWVVKDRNILEYTKYKLLAHPIALSIHSVLVILVQQPLAVGNSTVAITLSMGKVNYIFLNISQIYRFLMVEISVSARDNWSLGTN